ncbi:MAG: 4-hydroxythreonine-4-phosphate dehydrogenase PdxA [Nitrospinae bacterium]|nr:4-hydroxythreonine-4-phosphate dehydrogenase PdxA [Nitrospinota bacterium]MBL7020620.1 4-hydroxythreonine-4-phosphate dehydrogenase PdxA [Nitrospinaceae bacterium]
MSSTPIIALTIGDPAGIGPEVIVKAFQDDTLPLQARAVVIGDARLLQETAKKYAPEILIHPINKPEEGWYQTCTIDVIDLKNVPENIPLGKPCAEAGRASYEAIKAAVDLAVRNEVSAITTAPINKKSLHLAGYPFPGHTELLAHLTGSKQAALMMAGKNLRVVLVTTHVPLGQVQPLITEEKVLNTIRLTHEWLAQHVTDVPNIAVTGLNPHCGDGGIFGKEETDHILPALKTAQTEGIQASGPFSADALFGRPVSQKYDAVVCMYHDQGMIPVKMDSAGQGVNITLGLPILRTSVDHGTAFDIAGRNKACPENLKMALRTATRLSQSTLSLK